MLVGAISERVGLFLSAVQGLLDMVADLFGVCSSKYLASLQLRKCIIDLSLLERETETNHAKFPMPRVDNSTYRMNLRNFA